MTMLAPPRKHGCRIPDRWRYDGMQMLILEDFSLIPWHYAMLGDAPDRVSVRLWVRPARTPLFLEKTLSLEPGRAVLYIDETLRNEGGEPLDAMWGHHIAYGRPFLDEGAVIDISAKRFIVHEPMPGYEPRCTQSGISATACAGFSRVVGISSTGLVKGVL
ncbi:MAG: hypothetical protein GY759_08010 [Chloroflexi bacterium]|nr:hypothetical protein [Chloroflexota bacterium]